MKTNEKEIRKVYGLSSDCWLVQFEGFGACVNCEAFPFNLETGKLRKTSECGGGQTLALMTFKEIAQGMSIADQHLAREYWQKVEGCGFADFVAGIRNPDFGGFAGKHAWSYGIRKYVNHIRTLRQIGKEKQQHGLKAHLDNIFPFWELWQKLKDGKAKLISQGSYHRIPNRLCNCEATTLHLKGAYRDITIQYGNTRVFYYHQHAIVVKIGDTITLDSCGYRTPSTKERINHYLSYPYMLYQKKHVWYLRNNDKTKDDEPIEFHDGITLKVL